MKIDILDNYYRLVRNKLKIHKTKAAFHCIRQLEYRDELVTTVSRLKGMKRNLMNICEPNKRLMK